MVRLVQVVATNGKGSYAFSRLTAKIRYKETVAVWLLQVISHHLNIIERQVTASIRVESSSLPPLSLQVRAIYRAPKLIIYAYEALTEINVQERKR